MKKKYLGILADLDGTMNRGRELIPGADVVYRRISKRGLRWIFISNNATSLASDLARRITDLGIPVDDGQVVTSASALMQALSGEYRGARIMVLGEDKLIGGVRASGCEISIDPSATDIVVVAKDTGFTYDKLERAYLAIRNGARFWATNMDPTFPVPGGFLPGAGSIVAAVAAAAGRPPDRVFGKPSPDIADIALRQMDLAAELCLVVGDRMETDILFARNARLDSALVLTGATSRSDLRHYSYGPDYVLESITELETLLDSNE
ncbi:MAG: HAD-IIA family hydrolase [Desulfomonile tiedjei]|uniref:HAD-IIA family hydrolase n=1 Tax=Desulfomonile tiedjei TaxID=2358 RepID=A0A9D6V116_9BACT|nr:HAD-IIA family hydrolase [Desulfomonile tiedjei]